MLDFIKAKWYWILGGVVGLYIAIKLVESNSTSSSSAPSGSNPYAAYETPGVIASSNADSTALQVAALQNNSNLAQQQIAGSVAEQLATINLASTKDTNATNLAINGQNTTLASHVSDNSLLATYSNNNTTQAVTNSNNAAAVTINGQNTATDLAKTQSTNAAELAALENGNATQLAEYGIQSQVASQQITATQQVANAAIYQNSVNTQAALQTAASVANHQTDVEQQEFNSQVNLAEQNLGVVNGIIASGGLNHGTTNVEQSNLDAILALLNPGAVPAVASASASQGQSNAYAAVGTQTNWAGIISAMTAPLTSLGKAATTLFG